MRLTIEEIRAREQEGVVNPGFLPGLEATQASGARPPVYQTVSFSATRDYDEHEGWIRVQSKKKRRGAARRHAMD